MEAHKRKKALFRRFIDNIYTKSDVSKLSQSFQDPDFIEVFDELGAEVWDEAALHRIAETDYLQKKYKKEAQRLLYAVKQRKQHKWYRVYAVAASAVIIASFFLAGNYLIPHVFSEKVVYVEMTTSFGEKKRLLLPDGSIMTLNSCSYVRYPSRFINNERRIELEGEGFFNVEKNETQPFIIQTNRLDVKVLGTSFNVKSYTTDQIVSVAVEDGRVQVNLPDAATLWLNANEQIYFNTTLDEYSKHKNIESTTAWISGGLKFYYTPICDVAKELERIYNCRIEFAAGQIFDNLISGEHDNNDLESVLKAIEYTSHIKYKKNSNVILMYK